MSGGAAPQRKGDVFERAVVKDQSARGRVAFRVRQGGGEPVDIVAVEAMVGWARVYFIQCKRHGYLAPKERNALTAKAAAGATALLARPGPGGIDYEAQTDPLPRVATAAAGCAIKHRNGTEIQPQEEK